MNTSKTGRQTVLPKLSIFSDYHFIVAVYPAAVFVRDSFCQLLLWPLAVLDSNFFASLFQSMYFPMMIFPVLLLK